MESTTKFIISVLLTILITAVGTVGYMWIEGWEFLDAVYMTVITLATVGYGEVHEVSATGRWFTIFLVFAGVGFLGYVAATVVQFVVEGRMRAILGRRRLEKKIDRLKNHYIVCGYGRIGRLVCRRLLRKPLALVVIEKDPELIPLMDQDQILYISGDSNEELNLLKAGIKRAKGIVAALATDTDNVFLVLTARQLNPDLYIIARASHGALRSKLMAAGADQVESPYEMGAVSMAHRILRPSVTNFLDLAFAHRRKDIQMEEICVSPNSPLVDVMLKDSGIRQRFNLIIIAIKNAEGKMFFNPSFQSTIRSGDTLIAVGEEENLQQLEKILCPDKV